MAPTAAAGSGGTPQAALSLLLSSNFDSDLAPCVRTLVRILDNVTARPDNSRVRSIRLGNAAFSSRVGRLRGGTEFLEACGFERGGDDQLVLPAGPGLAAALVRPRRLLLQAAVGELGLEAGDIPPPPAAPPPALDPASASASASAGAAAAAAPPPFDPYSSQQHGARGGGGGREPSATERELAALVSKRERLEARLQKLGPEGRAIRAYRPGEATVPAPVPVPVPAPTPAPGGGDGSLLASRMRRMEEERRRREDGPLTTRAMRELESLKRARVYPHASLRIGFADGASVTARFLPTETVGTVASVVAERCLRPDLNPPPPALDLYVAPPRRLLDPGATLDGEGLVPAARVHASWGAAPPAWTAGRDGKRQPGWYLREELFASAAAAAAAGAAFPSSELVAEEGRSGGRKGGGAGGRKGGGAGNAAEAREEAMMRRMMGGKKGGGKKPGGGSGKAGPGGGGGRPKWFKG